MPVTGPAKRWVCLGPRADAAAPKLRALLKDPDPWLQSLACEALAGLGPEARKASVSDLLAMAARHNPADPRGMAHRAVCKALFSPYPGTEGISPKSILAESLDGVDRELLYPAIQSVLENDDSVARSSVQRLYGKLTDRDLVALLPAIVKAIRDLAPSNEMFGDDIRLAGLDLVSRLHLREGMPLCLSVVELKRWGSARRLQKGLECLARYGVHAKAVLPELREMRRSLKPDDKNSGLLDKAIAAIEASHGLSHPAGPQGFQDPSLRVNRRSKPKIETRLSNNESPLNKPASLALTTLLRCIAPGATRLHVAPAAAPGEAYYTEEKMYQSRPEPARDTPFGCIGASGLMTRIHPGVTVKVEQTMPGSPAAGKFSKGEIITGINGVALKGLNPFVALGNALTKAEATPHPHPTQRPSTRNQNSYQFLPLDPPPFPGPVSVPTRGVKKQIPSSRNLTMTTLRQTTRFAALIFAWVPHVALLCKNLPLPKRPTTPLLQQPLPGPRPNCPTPHW